MKKADTYSKTVTMTFPGMIARVHFPNLTPEERSHRMKEIQKAAEKLLKGLVRK